MKNCFRQGSRNFIKTIKLRSIVFAFFLISSFNYSFSEVYCSEGARRLIDRKPKKPSAPLCLNEIMKTHTCDDATISQYNSDIELYNSRLKKYNSIFGISISELKHYAEKNPRYARCALDDP